jgi:hypothetical protein
MGIVINNTSDSFLLSEWWPHEPSSSKVQLPN